MPDMVCKECVEKGQFRLFRAIYSVEKGGERLDMHAISPPNDNCIYIHIARDKSIQTCICSVECKTISPRGANCGAQMEEKG